MKRFIHVPAGKITAHYINISIWVMDKANHKFKHTTAVIKCDGTFSIAFLLRGGREPFEQHNKQLNIHWMLWLYIGNCCKCDLLLFARSFNSLFLLLSYYHHFFVPTVVWRFFFVDVRVRVCLWLFQAEENLFHTEAVCGSLFFPTTQFNVRAVPKLGKIAVDFFFHVKYSEWNLRSWL